MHLVSLPALPDEGVSHDPSIRKTVLLRRGTVPQVAQLAQAALPPGDATTAHAHADLHEVFVVTAGAGIATVDGAAHALSVGSCLVVEPGERHVIANTGTVDLVLLYFGVEPPTASPRGR
jgi:mannose-6-phosphate isomerase-like protein (cupin superfamily)